MKYLHFILFCNESQWGCAQIFSLIFHLDISVYISSICFVYISFLLIFYCRVFSKDLDFSG